jgi:two-component system chemotaxis response regulator CheB
MGILMTGMGRDGAQGLLRIKDAGGITVAQDETTSVVFGMPKAAIDLGASDKVVKLQDIAAEILHP